MAALPGHDPLRSTLPRPPGRSKGPLHVLMLAIRGLLMHDEENRKGLRGPPWSRISTSKVGWGSNDGHGRGTQTRLQGVQEEAQAGAARRPLGTEPREQDLAYRRHHAASGTPGGHLGRAGARGETQERGARDLQASFGTLIRARP